MTSTAPSPWPTAPTTRSRPASTHVHLPTSPGPPRSCGRATCTSTATSRARSWAGSRSGATDCRVSAPRPEGPTTCCSSSTRGSSPRTPCARGSPPTSAPPDHGRSAGRLVLAVALALDQKVDKGQHAVAQLLGEGDLRGRSVDAPDLEDATDDLLQVVVGARHDPAVQVSGAGHRVDLEDLGYLAQVLGHVVQPPLGDLEAHERQDLVSHGPKIEVGVEAADDAPLLELVEPRLHGPAGDTELPGELHHAGPGRVAHGPDQAGIESIHPSGQHEQCV